MEMIFYLLGIAALMCAAIIADLFRRRKSVAIEKENLRSEYGKVITPNIDNCKIDHEKLDVFYRAFCAINNEKISEIDDITYNDLELDALYEQLCRTSCSIGEEYLYARMRAINIIKDDCPGIYDECSDFSEDVELRTKLQLILRHEIGNSKKSIYKLFEQLYSAKQISIANDILSDLFVLISVVILFINPVIGIILLIAALFVAVTGYSARKKLLSEHLDALTFLIKCVRCALHINADLKDKELSSAGYFKEKLEIIVKKLKPITAGSFLLPSKTGTFSDPFNILLDYLRMIFRFDIIIYSLKIKQIVNMKDDIEALYILIGRLDTDIAISSYIKSLPSHCKAYSEETQIASLSVKGLYHPYVSSPVRNDISMVRPVILSGSNASGKSTFLKALGMSVLLAQSFGFAAADEYRASYLRLYTSMALRDNMLKHESYYIVESGSIKRICDEAAYDIPMIAIIDEVLRGTNTIERIAASYSILSSLKKSNVLLAAATHDTELCELLKDEFDCRYFSEVIIDNNISFPYKLYNGIGNTNNAIKLLDIIGFDANVTTRAEKMAQMYSETGRWEKV